MYDILKELAQGTFLAENGGRLFVLKAITPAECDVYNRLTSVNSPFAARVWGTVLQNDIFYAVRDYVQGITLTQCVKEYGVFGEKETRRIGALLCEGLRAVHACEIVHRDITPDNIILTADGQPVIIDYGIARLERKSCNRDTQILGTHGYASPEQYGFSQTTCRSDIYSLGAVMNYMLTGCLPTQQLCQGRMKRIVSRCLEVDEHQRYQSAAELGAVLNSKSLAGEAAYAVFRQDIGSRGKTSALRTVLLVVYYCLVAVTVASATTIGTTPRESLAATLCFFFMFGVTAFFAADVFRWSRRIPFVAKMNRTKRIVLRIVLTVIAFVLSLLFVIVIE